MAQQGFPRPTRGGGIITTTDPTSQVVARGHATAFYVNCGGDCWVAVKNTATPVGLTIANSVPFSTGTYGPFALGANDSHIHVAGRGGTPVVVVSLL